MKNASSAKASFHALMMDRSSSFAACLAREPNNFVYRYFLDAVCDFSPVNNKKNLPPAPPICRSTLDCLSSPD
jgi:hypothetical protein